MEHLTATAAHLVLAGRRVPLLDRARVYTCGITPYDVTHLGHAATFVWVDTLTRVLRRFLGVEPILCRNVTDIDDVLDAAALRAGTRPDHFAAFQQFLFEGDMSALQVWRPDHQPWAHRYVDAVIRLAGALLDSGAAYPRAGGVYFHGEHVPARAGLTEAEALRLSAEFGGRPDDPAKDSPFDVAIWQAAEPGHPAWPSPWGEGRPGWHAECVAMASSALGVGVDVHAGGADLRYPHHAYHAAIAEAFSGVTPHARAWFHVGMVTVAGAKMAKSAGNLVLVTDLLAEHPAAVVRLTILDRPWRQSWDYHPDLLPAAADRLERLHHAAARPLAAPTADLDHLGRLLSVELDVPAAIDLAIDTGGDAARLLIATLGLT